MYSVSVYRMRCPSLDAHNLAVNVFDEEIRANLKIDSKEKAELFASTLKYIISELDKRSKFDNFTSDFGNSTKSNTTSTQNHSMFESIGSKEEAALQASAMRHVANELANGPYGNAFNDINGPSTRNALPASRQIHQNIKNANYPTRTGGPNYSTLDAFS